MRMLKIAFRTLKVGAKVDIVYLILSRFRSPLSGYFPIPSPVTFIRPIPVLRPA